MGEKSLKNQLFFSVLRRARKGISESICRHVFTFVHFEHKEIMAKGR